MNRTSKLFTLLLCGALAVTFAQDQVPSTLTPQVNDSVRQLAERQAAALARLASGVTGYSTEVSASFTRPADTTAYALGDLVANSTTAGSVTPVTLPAARVIDGSGMIRRVRLKKTGTSITNGSFRVHFYKSALTIANGDNGAWLTSESIYLGSADVTMDRVFSDYSKGIGVPNQGSEINFTPATGTQNIYALIEARGAYTPASAETFTLTLELLQN